MPAWFTFPALLSAALIFTLRVTDMTLDTLHVLSVMCSRRAGFFQAIFFALAFSTLLQHLDNSLNIIGDAARSVFSGWCHSQ